MHVAQFPGSFAAGQMPDDGRRLSDSKPNADDATIVGESDALRYVMSRVEQVAATEASVLLCGETGTGKELIAHHIHRLSNRRDRPFVVVNCAALPATLIESELFGWERGAFTGAHASQIGRFELGHRGTVFLDEVSELPLELQSRLLRVLQEGQVARLGSPRMLEVDIRIITATNSDLAEEVRLGRFRRDLFYRLNVFPITLPTLRERRSDIPLLAQHLVNRFARAFRKRIDTIPDDVMRVLEAYDWPGNVRELENVLQRAIILSTSPVLSIREAWLPAADPAPAGDSATLLEVDRRHIVTILEKSGWQIEGPRGAARVLGMKPSTLRSRMAKLGIVRVARKDALGGSGRPATGHESHE
jgi:transcriptional regulator with GAF, ATPase, and Fis domain